MFCMLVDDYLLEQYYTEKGMGYCWDRYGTRRFRPVGRVCLGSFSSRRTPIEVAMTSIEVIASKVKLSIAHQRS